MIIWTGFGFLIALIAFASLLIVSSGMDYIMNDPTYYTSHAWTQTMAMIIAALFSWGFAHLVSKGKQRKLQDQDTGEEIILKSSHSLFFIEAKYWPYIYLIIGIILLFT